MKLAGLRTYLKFLSRNKVYTFVSVAGFAISLTFVIILSLYASRQVAMDSFHENGERIYLLAGDEAASNASPVAAYVADLLPEVEAYTRIMSFRHSIGRNSREWYDGRVMCADPGFFTMFSFPLIEGSASGVLTVDRSAVLSRTAAARLFGSEDPMGKSVFIMGVELTVTGVMEDFPYETHFEAPEVVVPYTLMREVMGDYILDHWGTCNYAIYFMARPGADLPSKEGLLLENFKKDYRIYRGGFRNEVRFIPLRDVYFSQVPMYNIDVKSGSLNATRIYFALALLILVISVMNYVNMTVAQAGFRGKEAAVKKLMGSGKGRIIGQLLGESFFMTAFALVLAVLLALLSERYFNGLLATNLTLAASLTRPGVIATLLGLLAVVSLVSGIIPALAVSSFRPIEVVKGTITRKVKTGYSKVLIVFQFAVCTALLICTLVMKKQSDFMLGYDVGFNRENILMLENSADLEYDGLLAARERLMAVPGVEAVGFSCGSPLNGGNNNLFEVDGRQVNMLVLSGDPVYRDIFGLKYEPVGSAIAADDNYVYVNRSGYNALDPDSASMQVRGWWRDAVITGIMEDMNLLPLHSPVMPTMFYNMHEDDEVWELVVKMSPGDVFANAEKVREVYSEITGEIYFHWYFADEHIQGWYDTEKRMSGIMGAFTILSITIMLMGVFAMSLYMIRQKEKEIGIRKVSGATVGEVLRMLNTESLARVAVAFIIACPVAYYGICRWLEAFAYRVDVGAGVFILAGVVVTALCLASVSWLTWRAARANPVQSLKSE